MEMKSSLIIHGRLAKMLGDKDIEEYFRTEYYIQLKECLDILDIDYSVTAVGILGKALEKQLIEYLLKSIKNKRYLTENSKNHSVEKIRKTLIGATHFKRLELAMGKKTNFGDNTIYQLKKKLLKDEDYQEILNISRARNDAFHGCDEMRYGEIEAKAFTYIERGVAILASLERENTSS